MESNRKLFLLMILSCASYTNVFAYKVSDLLSDPVTLTVNADACKMSKESDLGVCLWNKTGHDLKSDDIFLEEAYSAFKGGYSGVDILDYKVLQPGKFLILESNRNRIVNGDQRNHIPYDYVELFLRKPLGKILLGCEFKWDPMTPPYAQPAVLMIENTPEGYQCVYA